MHIAGVATKDTRQHIRIMNVKILKMILNDLPDNAQVLLAGQNGSYCDPHPSVTFVVQDTPYQWSRPRPGHSDPLVRVLILT